MAVNIDVFQANNPKAGCNVFIIGNQALVMDHFNHLREFLVVIAGHFFQYVPKCRFKPDCSAVPMNSETSFLGGKLIDLVRRTCSKHL